MQEVTGRWDIDLGVERKNKPYIIRNFDSLYIGDCDGIVEIRIGGISSSPLNPEEFSKLQDIKPAYYLYLTNSAQTGKHLVLYVTEYIIEKHKVWQW